MSTDLIHRIGIATATEAIYRVITAPRKASFAIGFVEICESECGKEILWDSQMSLVKNA